MPPTAFIAHQLPGRLRIVVPSKKGEAGFFANLVPRLTVMPNVMRVKANPMTGSILIAASSPSDALADTLERNGLLHIAPAEGKPAVVARRRRPRKVDARETLAFGLSGLGLLQMARGKLTGSASENLWNAYRAYDRLRNRPLTLIFIVFGLYQLMRGRVLNSATALIFYAFTARELSREQGSGEQ